MAPASPLDDARLRAVDDCLSAGRLSVAQQLLAQIDTHEAGSGITYLTTRLLYLRDRLDSNSVAERLRELLQECPNFPEAAALLQVAEQGVVDSASLGSLAGTLPFRQPTAEELALLDRPTLEPAQWPPPELEEDLAQPDSQRPTATGVEYGPWLVERRSEPAPRGSKPLGTPRVVDNACSSAQQLGPLLAPTPFASELFGVAPSGAHTTGAAPPSRPPPARSSQAPASQPPPSQRAPSQPPPSMRPIAQLAAARQLWPSIEVQLLDGDRDAAIAHLEQLARQQVAHLPHTEAHEELEMIALSCAELLNKSEITQHFAPFDLSLQSLLRLDVAVLTLLACQPYRASNSSFVLLLSAYVGETLRMAHRGSWLGGAAAEQTARVVSGQYEWRPFDLVRRWLHSANSVSLMNELQPSLALPGTVAWLSRREVNVVPRALWQGVAELDDVPRLARAYADSVPSLSCGLLYGRTLDGSLESLDRLDELLSALTASAVALEGQEPWLRRLALLAGCYVGEVARRAAGGRWLLGSEARATSPFVLQLSNGVVLAPIGLISQQAVSARPVGCADYVANALAQ